LSVRPGLDAEPKQGREQSLSVIPVKSKDNVKEFIAMTYGDSPVSHTPSRPRTQIDETGLIVAAV
jgi:hypothetical protein